MNQDDADFQIYFEKFEKMQRWIRNDLTNATIKAHAHFLVSMGIFNYIEMFGAFLGEVENYKRFNSALKYMSPLYEEVVSNLNHILKNVEKNKDTPSAYDCLRCGMAHGYLVKIYDKRINAPTIEYTIYCVENEIQPVQSILFTKCGLELIKRDETYYYLKIFNSKLITDLDNVFKKYKKDLLSENSKYKEHFLKRSKEINLDKFN